MDDEISTKTQKINLSSYERISLLEQNETIPIQFGWVFDEKNKFFTILVKSQSKRGFDYKSWELDVKLPFSVKMV